MDRIELGRNATCLCSAEFPEDFQRILQSGYRLRYAPVGESAAP